jgi:hypothetical protein
VLGRCTTVNVRDGDAPSRVALPSPLVRAGEVEDEPERLDLGCAAGIRSRKVVIWDVD